MKPGSPLVQGLEGRGKLGGIVVGRGKICNAMQALILFCPACIEHRCTYSEELHGSCFCDARDCATHTDTLSAGIDSQAKSSGIRRGRCQHESFQTRPTFEPAEAPALLASNSPFLLRNPHKRQGFGVSLWEVGFRV